MSLLPKSLARALAQPQPRFKMAKKQTNLENGTRIYHCSLCGSGPMKKDDMLCTNKACDASIEFRPTLSAEGRKRPSDAATSLGGHDAKKVKSEPAASSSSASSSPPAAAAPQPSSMSVRVSAATLTSSKLSLKAMYAVVDAATEAPIPRCQACQNELQPAPPTNAAIVRDRTPRLLSCGHSFCSACVHAQILLNHRSDKPPRDGAAAAKDRAQISGRATDLCIDLSVPVSFIPCTTCSAPHPLTHLLLGSGTFSSLEVLRSVPLNHALISILGSHAAFLSRLREFGTNTQRMCAAASAAASVLEVGPSAVDEVAQLELEVALHDQKVKQKAELIRRREEQMKRQRVQDEIDAKAAAIKEAARAERAAVAAAAAAAAAPPKKPQSEEVESGDDSDDSSDESVSSDSDSEDDTEADPALAAAAVSVGWGSAMASSNITGDLTADQRGRLQSWLGDSSLRKARLLYQGSRHGWSADNFFNRCSSKGPTLVLIKVAGCGNIFGSFTVVPWFRPPSTGNAPSSAAALFCNVFDRSYRSFLFSLANASDYPFRLTLSSSTGPAMVAHPTIGPMFGGKTKGPDGTNTQWPNVTLCCEGRTGDHAQGNVANDPSNSNCAYQVEEDPDNPPPAGFECNQDTLAGHHYFAMAEMEVYQLPDRK